MNGTSGMGEADMYGDEGGLDPHGAARLLVQTQRQAQRGLDSRSPWLSLLAAAVALVAVYAFMGALIQGYGAAQAWLLRASRSDT